VPDLDPEGARVTVNGKGRTIIHHCHRFSLRPHTQRLKQFGNERLELIKLDQHCAVGHFSRRKFDRIARFKQQTALGLMISFLEYRHLV